MAPTMAISWRKKLNQVAIPTIFECPEPTGTSSVASDSGDAATLSQKRTTATASTALMSLIANRNDQERCMKKRERARVTRAKMVNYCKQAGNDRA